MYLEHISDPEAAADVSGHLTRSGHPVVISGILVYQARKSLKMREKMIFGAKNENSPNHSLAVQDHSGHPYGPGNGRYGLLRPPVGPPTAPAYGWLPRVTIAPSMEILENDEMSCFLVKNENFPNHSLVVQGI